LQRADDVKSSALTEIRQIRHDVVSGRIKAGELHIALRRLLRPSSPLRNPALTPGAVVASDRETACAFGSTPRLYQTSRSAYLEQARQVFERYGIPYEQRTRPRDSEVYRRQ